MSKHVWTMGGQVYPESEPIPVSEGEVVRIKMTNRTMMWHPMHLHGHFFRPVLAGVPAPLSPLMHTLNVAPKETVPFDVLADNPGRWSFHCHNLYHLDAGTGRVVVYRA